MDFLEKINFSSYKGILKSLKKTSQKFTTHRNDIVFDSLLPYFKTYFNFSDDKNIEFSSNKIENFFKKTILKSVKKLMKIKKWSNIKY